MRQATRVLLFAMLCPACGGGGGGGSPADGGLADAAGDSGAPAWPVQFGVPSDGGPGGDPRGIATDSSGNVYVSGQFYGDSSFIAKFDQAGKELWAKAYSVADFWGIAVDADHGGAIYVAATKINPPVNAPLLLKLDLDGNTLWTQELTTSKPTSGPPTSGGNGIAVAVDASGNALIAGVSDSAIAGVSPAQAGEPDLFVARYDATGAAGWVTMLGTGTGTSASNLVSIDTDAQGNVLLASEAQGAVAGQTYAGGLGDILLAKFAAATGASVWVRDDGSADEDGAYGVAVDSAGNAYVAGFSLGAFDGETNHGLRDAVLLAYDANGNRLWTREIGSNFDEDGLGVGTGPDDLPIMGGISFGDFDGHTNPSPSGAGGNPTPIAVKYDASGKKLWSNEIGTDLGGGNAVAVDAKGDTFVVGASSDSDKPVSIARFEPDGKAP